MTIKYERARIQIKKKSAACLSRSDSIKRNFNQGVFLKSNYGGKWKLSGSRGGFDARARRTAPEGGRDPQAF